MIIKVKLTLNIGYGQGRHEVDEVEVPENWTELTGEEQEDYLQEHWNTWAWNFIDGGITEIN